MTSRREPRAPRSSAEVVRSSLGDLRASRRARAMRRTVASAAVLALLVWGANSMLVGRPVSSALAADPRCAGFEIRAHFQYYVLPTTLVLDLRRADPQSAESPLHALLVAARALQAAGRTFPRVVLARAGTPVLVIPGADLGRLGRDYAAAGNPAVVLRELARRLRTPGGTAPPAADAEAAARLWVSGGR